MGETFEMLGVGIRSTLAYLDARVDGGRARLLEKVQPDDRSLFESDLDDEHWYDLMPYIRLAAELAKIEGTSVRRLMTQLSTFTAETDLRHLRPSKPNSVEMAARLPTSFGRYFRPCRAELDRMEPGMAFFRLCRVPASHAEFFRGVNEGFVVGALGIASSRLPRVSYGPPTDDEPVGDEPTLCMPFEAMF